MKPLDSSLISEADTPATKGLNAVQRTDEHTIQILVVDDDRGITALLKKYLTNGGHDVTICNDGTSAKQQIETRRFGILIVDMMLPDASGVDILKYARGLDPDVLVIIITGYASIESAIAAVREGAYDYLRKPFKLEELGIAVNQAADKIKVLRENRRLLNKLNETYAELMALKKDCAPGAAPRVSHVNFYSSDIPVHQYFKEDDGARGDLVEKMTALSNLKKNGSITDDEYQQIKRHLLQNIRV